MQTPANGEKISFHLPEDYAGKWDWERFEFLFDIKKAEKFLPLLADMYAKNRGVFAAVQAPQLRWRPEGLDNDSTMTSLWLFYSSLFMRSGVKSDSVLYWSGRLFEELPELFSPEYVIGTLSPAKIRDILENFFPRSSLKHKAREHGASWYKNSEILLEHFGGDSLNIWKGGKDFYSVWRRVDPNYEGSVSSLRGILKKIFSLCTLWHQDYGLTAKYLVPPPVDFHAFRILIALKIIEPSFLLSPLKRSGERLKPLPEALIGKMVWRIKDQVRDIVADFLFDFCRDYKVSPYNLSHALWFLSGTLCARHPQAKVKRPKSLDPVYTFFDDLNGKPERWPVNFRDSCLLCPIEGGCEYIFASQPHFVYGLIVPEKRARFPHPRLVRPDVFGKIVFKKSLYIRANGSRNGKVNNENASLQLDLGFTEHEE